ncbi:UNVERIFIED_CONTAM: VQ motif-containing protein 11 [Sesamum radiatum]|uniref:VQ motif-containing protein 11 n=1 Tax=Sesamum radiatum TaxID=300843 RepID=A0AAW2VKL6_SESRA
MASSSSSSNPSLPPFSNAFDPNTTFVQADPSTFRAVVQRLTGAAGKPNSSCEMGPRRPAFKLHERRPTARKLEIKLKTTVRLWLRQFLRWIIWRREGAPGLLWRKEERAIADKGFYLHPSPLSTPRGSDRRSSCLCSRSIHLRIIIPNLKFLN